ncbi:MAG: mechanosensitive ion channel family protein [Candidatus Omnitrophota bacterium]
MAGYYTQKAASAWDSAAHPVREIDLNVLVLQPLKNLLANIIGFVPVIIEAAGVVLIGWLISKLVRMLIKLFLTEIRFDQIAETTGIAGVLDEQKIKMTPSAWVAALCYWFGIFMTWIIALQVLRLRIPSMVMEEIGHLLTSIFVGFLVFIIGLFLSMVISRFIETTARSLKIAHPGVQAGIIRWVIIVMTFGVTLAYFGFPMDFLLAVFAAVGGSLCIAFVISFGVGGIQWAPKILEKLSR